MRPRREKDPKVETCPATLVSLCHFTYSDFLSPDLMVSLPFFFHFDFGTQVDAPVAGSTALASPSKKGPLETVR